MFVEVRENAATQMAVKSDLYSYLGRWTGVFETLFGPFTEEFPVDTFALFRCFSLA